MKIVITGGAHAGKSTLINALATRGFATVPEAALDVIDSLGKLMGPSGRLRWREAEPVAFQRLIFERQLMLEAQSQPAREGLVFCDRGMYDGLAYSRLYNVDIASFFEADFAQNEYEMAFVLDTLSNFDVRAETGRITTEEQSRLVSVFVEQAYKDRGVPTIRVPQMSVADRLGFILENIRKAPDSKAFSR